VILTRRPGASAVGAGALAALALAVLPLAGCSSTSSGGTSTTSGTTSTSTTVTASVTASVPTPSVDTQRLSAIGTCLKNAGLPTPTSTVPAQAATELVRLLRDPKTVAALRACGVPLPPGIGTPTS
jgi:hypothetical protein